MGPQGGGVAETALLRDLLDRVVGGFQQGLGRSQSLLRAVTAQTAMLVGCFALFTGVGLTLIAIAFGSTALFLVGRVIAGVGFGPAFLGNIRAVTQVAAPAQRAGTPAVLYIVSCTMFSIPIVIAGVAETHFSAHDVALVFSGGVTALASIGIAASLAGRGRRPVSQGPVMN